MQNVIALTGRLTTEPDLRTVQANGEDRSVATLRVAVDRGARGQGADCFDVTVWGKQGEACGQYLVKGQQIAVTGSLRSREWKTPDGSKRSGVDILASSIDFGAKPNGSGAPVDEPTAVAADDDVPF
jgi:single-strand DNA-binding protein